MEKDREKRPLSKDVPTSSREDVRAGELSREGLRGGRPDLGSPGPGRVAPDVRTVAAGGVAQAHPADAPEAPDSDESI